MIYSLFRKASAKPTAPRLPDGVRVYAVGDIHGCDDQFAKLLTQIDVDNAARGSKRRILILLGDLIDRGPASAKVIERALHLQAADPDVRILAGNHEEMLLGSLLGDPTYLRMFDRNGGRETAISYGIHPTAYDGATLSELTTLLHAAIPPSHVAFIQAFEDQFQIGDYAFVHAGVRPGIQISDQSTNDLRWIRDRFISHNKPFEKFIVHGHTISIEIDERSNRLGIDTGAYRTGRLSAVGLEGNERWFLST